MERWLSQQLSQAFSVWSHFEFLFPGNFFNALTLKLYPDLINPLFERSLLCWQLYDTLTQLSDPVFTPVTNYLKDPDSELKRFQLAQQIAHIFDQYQMMRPDMLESWQQNRPFYSTDSEAWQMALWQLITRKIGTSHRGNAFLKLIDDFNHAEPHSLKQLLPERISVFGIHSLPPLFLAVLQSLSRHCDIHFYLLNPSQVFWADVPSKKKRIQLNDTVSHPLLSALGQQGREFQQLLLDQAQFDLDLNSFDEISPTNVLHQLQHDILFNDSPSIPLENDRSITIHSCHSQAREVEIVKNQILDALENDPELQLSDIIIMAPDIQTYEPYISAIFSDIPHAIADRSLRLGNAYLDCFINFLTLCQSRFGWQTVLDLLEQPLIHPQFDIDASDLDVIRHWINDTRVRWGKSSQHKEELGLPATPENTWQQAIERLLTGYASNESDYFIDNILPYTDIEGTSASPLGGLYDFLNFLFKASNTLKQDRTLKEWQSLLFEYADILFTDEQANERQQFNELLLKLGEDFAPLYARPVSLQVISFWLETFVSEQKSSQGFLRGQLTFCSMLPMRSIPFKVIALLGMNDGEFPDIERPPVFDLLAQNYRPGDRSSRNDDRYQFLEILLSARQQLIITYIGQSVLHNDEIPPSIIISELLDTLYQCYQLENLIQKHPLQPFSPQYFMPADTSLFSYDKHAVEIARSLHSNPATNSYWWQGEIPADTPEIIEAAELMAFYRHPQKYFLQKQLQLRLQNIEASQEERELFHLDSLDAYSIKQQWLDAELKQQTLPLEKLHAQGRWPSGTPGALEYQQWQEQIKQFAAQIRQIGSGEALPAQLLDIQIDSIRITGKLTHVYQNNSLLYRFSKLKGKDFIQAWLHHLLINQLSPQDTYLISEDKTLCFSKQNAGRDSLRSLINIFLEGQKQPAAFFTEPAFYYLQQSSKKRAQIQPLSFCIKQTIESIEHDAALKLLYPDEEALKTVLNQDFEELCTNLLLPVWSQAHEI